MKAMFSNGTWTQLLEPTKFSASPEQGIVRILLLGKSGLRTLLGHLVTMAETLRNRLTAQPAISVMNPENFGPVTLFRVYPDDVDTFEMPKLEQTDARYAAQLHRFNDYNRQVFQAMHAEALRGDGVVISMTDRFRETDYGQPVVALKSYIMSPFSDEQYVQAVVDSVERARKQVAGVFK